MSIYYTVKEHLVITGNSDCFDIACSMKSRLALLGSMLLLDEASVDSIILTADGTEYTFSGNEITTDYHNIVRVLGTAKNIDMTAEYGTTWHVGCDETGILPISMCNFINEAIEETPEIAHDIFYSVYIEADCDEGNGTLYAFGERNGRFYSGAAEYTDVSEFPENGVWQTEAAAISLSLDDTADYDVNAIDSVCRELRDSFSVCKEYSLSFADGKISIGEEIRPDTFIAEDNSIEFHLNNPRLESAEDFEKLIRLFNELNELTDGECGYIFEFADWSGADARLVKIDFDENGKIKIKMAEIV